MRSKMFLSSPSPTRHGSAARFVVLVVLALVLASCSAMPRASAPAEQRSVSEPMGAPPMVLAPAMPQRDQPPPALPPVPMQPVVQAAPLEAQEALADAVPMAAAARDEAMAAEGMRWAWDLDDGEWHEEAWDPSWHGVEPVPVVQYAPVREFPVPDYSQPYAGPRVDFRDTIYWAPSVFTNGEGRATLRFYASDAVTSFRASVEGFAQGGQVARGEGVFAAKLPVSVAVKLPLEVTRGDRLELPVTVANDTERVQQATIEVELGRGFAVEGEGLPQSVTLAPGERKSFFLPTKVVGDGKRESDGRLRIATRAGSFSDEVERTVRVVPEGFPLEATASGTLTARTVVHEVEVKRPLDGTLVGSVRLYPSPTSTMVSGLDSMLRQPGGCFEQTSSSNYPNVMVLDYLQTYDVLDPALMSRSQGLLDGGYQLLTGYESPSGGFEWFGADPGHEALTAFGVMQFTAMQKVYDVDAKMLERTTKWLLERRDGKGGYHKNPMSYHSWANSEVTDAYLTYALTEVGVSDLARELEVTRKLARSSDDAYVLALAANTLLNVDPTGKETAAAVARLASMQEADGAFRKAAHSVVMSTGQNLEVETTALAARAFMKSGKERKALDAAIGFVRSMNNGWGGYGSTQATVLALQALTEYATNSARLPDGVRISVSVNGQPVHELTIDQELSGEMVLGGLEQHLREGKNRIELTMALPSQMPEGVTADDVELPYSVLVGWRMEQPASSPQAMIHVDAELKHDQVALGESVRMSIDIANQQDREQPMTLARVGIPGGLTTQTWQLKELREKGQVDFYETREREVILYFRKMAPRERRRLELDLVASVPGTFEAPASSAYLYYTDEHKYWEAPERITITR